jgi:hypothetical protein
MSISFTFRREAGQRASWLRLHSGLIHLPAACSLSAGPAGFRQILSFDQCPNFASPRGGESEFATGWNPSLSRCESAFYRHSSLRTVRRTRTQRSSIEGFCPHRLLSTNLRPPDGSLENCGRSTFPPRRHRGLWQRLSWVRREDQSISSRDPRLRVPSSAPVAACAGANLGPRRPAQVAMSSGDGGRGCHLRWLCDGQRVPGGGH